MVTALVLLAFLAAASWAHYAFWKRRLALPPSNQEIVWADTHDGWRLALARRPAAAGAPRGTPVLLLHGLAVNRFFMDFGAGANSLAAYLAGQGFECFSLDLRGHGSSRPGPGRDWTVDDYVRSDLPAALAAIRRVTGASKVLLVGHSQGGLVALARAALEPEAIAGVVAMGVPVSFAGVQPHRLMTEMVFAFGPWNRVLAIMLAPFAGLVHLGAAQKSINTRNVDRPLLQRMLASAVENISSGVARQFRLWIAEDSFRSLDGADDYRIGLSRSRQPALFVAGPADGLAPPFAVRAGYELWGGPKQWFCADRASGLSADYGHGDLIFGRRAPQEIFPVIRDWLAARSTPGAERAA